MQLSLPWPKHIVALSGGGDSTAMALWLAENERRDYEYIGNWTGNEPPALFVHLANLEGLLRKPIHRVTYKHDLYGVIDEVKMIPNFRARFCTRMLKIEPTIAYMEEQPRGSTLYVGLLADEEERPGIYGEDIRLRFPLRELGWNKAMVRLFLARRGVTIPKRTDCKVCPYQRIQQWFELWRDDREEFDKAAAYEQKYGHTFRSAGRDTWPAALIDLGSEFAKGRKVRPYVKKNEIEVCRVCSM
jgi:PP-loop superfamily ATP-utilizing enzyme